MSAISFKNFISFVDMDEKDTITNQELYELFGDELNENNIKAIRNYLDKLSEMGGNASRRDDERVWQDTIADKHKPNFDDPRKMYKDRNSWAMAIGKQASKNAKFEKNQVIDENGYVIAKWNPDKMEGWIELRPVKEEKNTSPVGTVSAGDLFSGKKNPHIAGPYIAGDIKTLKPKYSALVGDDATNGKMRVFQVIDGQTGKPVGGKHKDANSARRFRDKKDLEYGAVRYTVKEM